MTPRRPRQWRSARASRCSRVPAVLTWDLDAGAWPVRVRSAAFELGYVITLAARTAARRPERRLSARARVGARARARDQRRCAGRGDLGAQVAGVLLVAAGVLLVRGMSRTDDRAAVALAFACGACIAGYTVIDSHGLDHAAPLPYLWMVLALTSVAYMPLIARSRGAASLRAAVVPTTAVTAVLFFTAYLLVLAALRLAEPGPVAAVRETSVVIATALGALILHERVTRARAAGALVVVAGAALIALS